VGNGERVAGHLQCWVEELLDPEAAVVLTGPCLSWSLLPDHVVRAFGPWASTGWRWMERLELSPVSLCGDCIPVHTPAGKLYLQIPLP
jgi:hypothetical protein